MTATRENMVLAQFPEPARPLNSYDTTFKIQSSESTGYSQEQTIDQSYVVPLPERPSVVKENGEGKSVLLYKLLNRVLDKCDKHIKSQSTTSRCPQQPVIEKLERFKVRIVLPEEVVKEDNKK